MGVRCYVPVANVQHQSKRSKNAGVQSLRNPAFEKLTDKYARVHIDTGGSV